jgi:diguanylate cyclase (GGDEF)-like protein/PAS domain S-box-containing protein
MNLQTLYQLIECAADAIVVTDDAGLVQFWNKESESLIGFSGEEMLGKTLQTVFPQEELLEGKNLECEAVCRDGERIWVERSCNVVDTDDGKWSIHVIRNVEVRRRRMEELERVASTDSLSGLLNRREFQRQLESHLGSALTLAIVDIDNFKAINDQFGHWVGDEAIQFVAKNLSDLFPTAFCIARLGGDEFGVLLECESEAQARMSFEDFQKQSTELAASAHLTAIPKVSIGVAFSERSGNSARELLTVADKQMYIAKSAGRNRTSVATVAPKAAE